MDNLQINELVTTGQMAHDVGASPGNSSSGRKVRSLTDSVKFMSTRKLGVFSDGMSNMRF